MPTVRATSIFKACEYRGLTFQASIHIDIWAVVHHFIGSPLTLNTALQRVKGGEAATSAWLPDQSVNNKAWLILQNEIFKRHKEVLPTAASVATRLPAVGRDLLSQFPCNKVEGCDLNFLIHAPTPPLTYLSPYCILCLVALPPNMLLHYLIALHLFPISGGVAVQISLPKTNNSCVVFLQLLMFLCFFFYFSFICHWCCSVVRTANSSAGSRLCRLSLFSFCFLRLSLRWNMIVVIPVSDCSTETQTFDAVMPRSWDRQRAVV